jgi:N-methylhydantoinase A
MRLAVDTGGTFTDLVVEDDSGALRLFKAPTVPEDPVRGVLACLDLAAAATKVDRTALLADSELFVHGTTRGLNAILTRTTARTAFVTTAGHRDILLYREGGRTQPFNHMREYPDPYVPRRLTYEVRERIGPAGEVIKTLDDEDVLGIIERMKVDNIEAVGVCLLWSMLNTAHEERIGELFTAHLPEVNVTLSHRLNPSIREYRRASSACIDASLKPVMTEYLSDLERQLREDGFAGRLLMISSAGGLLELADARDAPIHTLGSGPAMAPIAGRHYASREGLGDGSVIVTDAGGTSFDVSLVRRGAIPWTRETWLGEEYSGDITGFPSVDVRSIGAGGGSIAWVDDGGLLRVGPKSAGSDPGPACYARGGTQATVTDACVTLGLLDPDFFLGGAIRLDADAARSAITRQVAAPLDLDTVAAAWAVLMVTTEQMVRAIEETTVYRGVDPADAVLIGGGGAAGFNIVAIARRLGCGTALVPAIGPGLSAAGALLSDVLADYAATVPTVTTHFAFAPVNRTLDMLVARCRAFAADADSHNGETTVQLFAEARYPGQVWELEVPLRVMSFDSEHAVEEFRSDFHEAHHEVFGVADPESAVELVSFRARVTCHLHARSPAFVGLAVDHEREPARTRAAYLDSVGWSDLPVYDFDRISPDIVVTGPALIDAPQTTVVVYPYATARRSRSGSLLVDPAGTVPSMRNGE